MLFMLKEESQNPVGQSFTKGMVNSANTVEMDAKQNRSYKVCKSLVAWIGVNWGRG